MPRPTPANARWLLLLPLALAVAAGDGDLARLTVGDLMASDLASIAPDSPLADAIGVFADRRVCRLLVVDGDGALAGILSWTDLIGHVSERGLGRIVAGIEGRRSG